jgi:NADPH-dependent 2,4-dienoyl-CoA reductase/sulfur reductase-like enzyme
MSKGKTRVVIVGGGLAGHRAADALQRARFDGQVVLVTDEPHAPYDRPPLSKQLLAGTMGPDACAYPSLPAGVDARLATSATALHVERSIVSTSAGDIEYDALLIATGRRARPWPDAPRLAGFHILRTLDDAIRFRAAVEPATPIAIIGAGFIGCEAAATLRGLGVTRVSLIDVAPHPMPVLGPEIGARAATLHRGNGVDLYLGTKVAGFGGTDRVETVQLEDGTEVPARLVLVAIGSLPNSEWLADSGLSLVRGALRCDEHCIVLGADNVAVAGDLAAFPHPGVDTEVCVEHWATARDMGTLAAENLIADHGSRRAFRAVPTFWSDQYDTKIKSAGLLAVADRFEIVDDGGPTAFVAEAYRGDELVGAVAFNRNRAILGYQQRLMAELAVR